MSAVIGEVLVCAIADGAGSARFADEGSLLIVERSLEYFRGYFQENPTPDQLIQDMDRSDGETLLADLVSNLQMEADKRGASIRDFASTLLVAVIHKSGSLFYQIGDGVWCLSKSGILGAATWPQQGEYAGQTDFVTSSSASSSLQFSKVQGHIDYVVGMTDGMERLALDIVNKVPHHGFFEPLIRELRASTDTPELRNRLSDFLDSERVRDRTDDDKTIALMSYGDCL